MFSWFKKRRRNIFQYWDGERNRACDPLVAWRYIFDNGYCTPQDDFGPAIGVEPYTFDPEAQERVLKMARTMFQVKPWSEGTPGLTVEETLELLWSFINYMKELKKKQDSLPTSSPPTESTSPQSNSKTTEHMSESYSINPELTSNEPSSFLKRSLPL